MDWTAADLEVLVAYFELLHEAEQAIEAKELLEEAIIEENGGSEGA